MSDYKQTRDAVGNVTSQYGQMLRNLDDDLVKRLRDNTTRYYEDKMTDRLEAADRIEELGVAYVQADHIEWLEAKLAKAVEALSFYADPTYNGYDVCLEDYGLSMTKGCVIQDGGDLANKTLAELKGQDDE